MTSREQQNLEKQIERQMGCMAGFFHIFDRQHILTGGGSKRLHSTKRLTSAPPPPPAADMTSESEKSAPPSSEISKELPKTKHPNPSPEPGPRSPLAVGVVELPTKSLLPLPVLDLKEGTRSSWKFSKEAPRLSLDSRATTDAKGSLHPKEIRTNASILLRANRCDSLNSDTTDASSQNRSPSVIARLMGLEPLAPNSSGPEQEKKPELRRSASESRVSRDLFNSKLMADGSSYYPKQHAQSQSYHPATMKDCNNSNKVSDAARYADPRNVLCADKAEPARGLMNKGAFNSVSPWRAAPQRRSFFDSGDVFPEPPKQAVSVYGEIERRLRMRGIDEPSKDLETLKQILEALQLKGLLHSKQQQPSNQNQNQSQNQNQNHQVRHRNFVYDESPIVIMRPSRSPVSTPTNRRMVNGNDCSSPSGRNAGRGGRRSYGEISPSVSPRRERGVQSPTRTGRSSSPNSRSEGNNNNNNARRSNSLVKPKPLSVDTQRSRSMDNRRVPSPVQSPKLNPTAGNRSPRNSSKSTAGIRQKEKTINIVAAAEDESSSISGSSITTSTDTERWKVEEYKEGRNLLERCDKLLHSIAEMAATDTQPSPVSVLDSSFYKDESLTPSPVTTKRTIDFKDISGELDEETWSPIISPIRSKSLDTSDDCDFVYISDILRASHYLSEDSDVFLLLEKHQYLKGNDTSKVSRLQRKLIFDTINEIVDRNRRLPPWKAVSWTSDNVETPPLDKVWLEFQKIRARENAEDLFEIISSVLKKDLAGDAITGWGGDCAVEMSETVLDIERLVFKDLIGEAIQDLAELASTNTLSSSLPRRKLVF